MGFHGVDAAAAAKSAGNCRSPVRIEPTINVAVTDPISAMDRVGAGHRRARPGGSHDWPLLNKRIHDVRVWDGQHVAASRGFRRGKPGCRFNSGIGFQPVDREIN